jgi:hypothetical protein
MKRAKGKNNNPKGTIPSTTNQIPSNEREAIPDTEPAQIPIEQGPQSTAQIPATETTPSTGITGIGGEITKRIESLANLNNKLYGVPILYIVVGGIVALVVVGFVLIRRKRRPAETKRNSDPFRGSSAPGFQAEIEEAVELEQEWEDSEGGADIESDTQWKGVSSRPRNRAGESGYIIAQNERKVDQWMGS